MKKQLDILLRLCGAAFLLLLALWLFNTATAQEKSLQATAIYDQPTSKVGVFYMEELGLVELNAGLFTDGNNAYVQFRIGIVLVKKPVRLVLTPFYMDLLWFSGYRTPCELKIAKRFGPFDLGVKYTLALGEPGRGYLGAGVRCNIFDNTKDKTKKPTQAIAALYLKPDKHFDKRFGR